MFLAGESMSAAHDVELNNMACYVDISMPSGSHQKE